MAQPLARSDDAPASGIEAAATSLEQAFARLEAAVTRATAKQLSLKETQEKLNHLLRETQEKSALHKQATGTILKRLTHTLDKLEKAEA